MRSLFHGLRFKVVDSFYFCPPHFYEYVGRCDSKRVAGVNDFFLSILGLINIDAKL